MDLSSNNELVSEIPIALRKGKRRSSVLVSPKKPRFDGHSTDIRSAAITPARRSKRLRFSDSVLPSSTNADTTGITPYLRRASLDTPSSRRQVTPTTGRFRRNYQFTPFKQVLDERVKRRIRRNGLSEEMNDYYADKRTKVTLKKEIEDKDAELQKLRAELDATRSPPIQKQDCCTSVPISQERIDEVEAELEALRQSFALDATELDSSWTHVPRGFDGPGSESGDTVLIYEDEDAREDLVHDVPDLDSVSMGLELEAARQAKQSMLGSFKDTSFSPRVEVDFADSPARRKNSDAGTFPRTPRTLYHSISKQLKATTHRAESAELALKTLETEVLNLGFRSEEQSAFGTVTAILDHFRQARLELERTIPGETVVGFENAQVLPELIQKLKLHAQHLKNKELELKVSRDQQHSLKGNFEKAILAAEKATAQIKDLESALDSQAEEMLGVRMRAQDLERNLTQKEKDTESLTNALNKYREDVSRLELLISQLEQEHMSDLEHTRSENVQLVSDFEAKVAAETHGRRAAEESAVSRLAIIDELELTLAATRQQSGDLETRIDTLQSQVSSGLVSHSQEIGSLNARISTLSTALTHANAEVSKLRTIKNKLESRLRDEVENGARAVEAIQADLIRSVAKTNEDRKKYIRGAKVRIANWEMEVDDESGEDANSSVVGPMTPSSLVRFADLAEEIEFTAGGKVTTSIDDYAGDSTNDHIPGRVQLERGRTRKSRSSDRLPKGLALALSHGPHKPSLRRRYDSGIGMSPVSEAELEAAFAANDDGHDPSVGLITPDLSSEGDDIELEHQVEQKSIEY